MVEEEVAELEVVEGEEVKDVAAKSIRGSLGSRRARAVGSPQTTCGDFQGGSSTSTHFCFHQFQFSREDE